VESPRSKVLDLETTKTTQAIEIESLKRRVKKLEKKQRPRTHKLKRLYKVGLKARGRFHDQEDAEMLFVVSDDLRGEEVFVSQEVPLKEVSAIDEVNVLSTATTTTATIDDITLAKALIVIKSEKPKATAASTKPRLKGLVQEKGKGKMVEPKPVMKLSKKDQLMLDEELAFKLQAEYEKEEEEEERLAKEKS
nr:hypothetical protein [Tanacetum cinerariifolium]